MFYLCDVFIVDRDGRLSVPCYAFRRWKKYIFVWQNYPPQSWEPSIFWAGLALLSAPGHLLTLRHSCGLLLPTWHPSKTNYWVKHFNVNVTLFCLPEVNSIIIFPLICLFFPDYRKRSSNNNNNLIGLNRIRRRHNAIFVSFTEASVPTQCLEGAITNWNEVCQKDHDKQAEEQLRKVCDCKTGASVNVKILYPGNNEIRFAPGSQSYFQY